MSLRKIWVVRGRFLHSSLDYMEVLHSLYDEGRERALLFDVFDIEHFTRHHENPLTRIVQAFNEALDT